MASNGRLPQSTLAPIRQGYLRKDAAAAWNAMNAESQRRYGVTLVPLGSKSSYRTYEQQVELYRTSRPGWAAVPGTSNHGWGLAVDIASQQMRGIVDRIGEPYGWAKKWSDASWEWWHLKWREGVWSKPKPDPLRKLGKRQRAAAERLLYHRREAIREARTGKGRRYRRQVKWREFWRRRCLKLLSRASGERRHLLARVLNDRDGNFN